MAKSLKKVAPAQRTAEVCHVKDLISDPANRRKHNPRNIGMVVDALQQVGAARSIVIDEDNVVLAGNGVSEAAMEAGITRVQVVEVDGSTLVAVRRTGLTEAQKRALAMFDNRAGELAEWNADQLAADAAAGLDLKPWFSDEELAGLLAVKVEPQDGLTDPDDVPAVRATDIQPGDLFELGKHRLLCGDTTDPQAVLRLTDDRLAMLHADPPYGMGKEADGIANDNLYAEKLDAFQMLWWRAWSRLLADNGSIYVWGNAPELWRLWYVGGLSLEPDLMLRNEIVWDKGSGFGMSSAGAHSYPPATERCLFLMRGEQFLGNQNKDDFWEGYEPLRSWLESERDRSGLTNRDVNALTETQMAGHWFGRSQFMPISKGHYETIAAGACGRAFTERYEDLFARMFPNVRKGGNDHRRELSAELRESRSYFDNTHAAMTDVWQFPRVVGEDRFGHATPKPVAMVARAIKSSSRSGDAIGVPFCGTGPEFIAAEQHERAAFGAEIEPNYCQVIIDRWEAFTGQQAQKVGEAVRA